jgi:hypothetical protein
LNLETAYKIQTAIAAAAISCSPKEAFELARILENPDSKYVLKKIMSQALSAITKEDLAEALKCLQSLPEKERYEYCYEMAKTLAKTGPVMALSLVNNIAEKAQARQILIKIAKNCTLEQCQALLLKLNENYRDLFLAVWTACAQDNLLTRYEQIGSCLQESLLNFVQEVAWARAYLYGMPSFDNTLELAQGDQTLADAIRASFISGIYATTGNNITADEDILILTGIHDKQCLQAVLQRLYTSEHFDTNDHEEAETHFALIEKCEKADRDELNKCLIAKIVSLDVDLALTRAGLIKDPVWLSESLRAIALTDSFSEEHREAILRLTETCSPEQQQEITSLMDMQKNNADDKAEDPSSSSSSSDIE